MTDRPSDLLVLPEDNGVRLTMSQAARKLGITTATLARYCRDGRVRSTRTMGNHRRFFESVIDAVLEGRWEDAAVRPGDPE